MGKLRAFQISLLNNPQGVYRAGDMVCGQLLTDLAEPMQMRSIKLHFFGGANVHWTERHSTGSGKNRRTVTRHYSNNESYVDQSVIVWGSAGGGGLFSSSPEHPAGQHIYPFQFQLPQNLPSSYEGAWGRVRYQIQGTIDKPWKFDHHTKVAFTVHSVYDLNLEPRARQSTSNEQFKTLCCLCCTSGPITGQLRVDRMGYVPGEFVTVNGEVDNKSNRTMACSKLKFLMVTTFHATSKSRSTEQVIEEIKHGEIQAGDSDSWHRQTFHIPPLPPSQLIHCNIIDIKYFVQLVVDPTGPAFDLLVPVEILIGNVPLQNVTGFYTDRPFTPPPAAVLANQQSDQPPAPVFTQPSAPPPQAAPTNEAPPPSYAECVFGKVDIHEENDNEYTRGQMNYAPVYSYYSWDQQQQPPQPHN